jgi:hypothetical protein
MVSIVATQNISKVIVTSTGVAGLDGDLYKSTSVSSIAISIVGASISFTTGLGLAYIVGNSVLVENDISNYMIAIVTAYNPATGALVATVTQTVGTGTFTSWGVNLSGGPGPQGIQGIQGIQGPSGPTPAAEFFADQLEDTITGWAVSAFASLELDSVNTSMRVRAFDDTEEEGVGFARVIPTGQTNITLKLYGKALTAPAATRTVGVKLYYRKFSEGIAQVSFSSVVLDDLSIPADAFYKTHSQTLTLASIGAVAGDKFQFCLTRLNPTAGTELVGDWYLYLLVAEFS